MITISKIPLRKIGALIFAGCFVYNLVWESINDANSALVNPTRSIGVSIIAWLLAIIVPLAAAYFAYQNKKFGLVIIRVYTIIIIAAALPEIFYPGLFASVPIPDAEKLDTSIRAAIFVAIISFILICTFFRDKNLTD